MNVRRFVPVVALIVLGLAAPAFAQVKIAIANPVVIFDKMLERQAEQDKMQAMANNLQNQFTNERKRLEDARKSIDMNFKPGTPVYQDELNKIIQAAITLEATAKVKQLELNRAQVQTMLVLFNKIQEAIKLEAKDYDLVITDQRPELPTAEQLGNVDINQMRALILGRSILWSSGNTPDITQKVVDKLNTDYKATTQPVNGK